MDSQNNQQDEDKFTTRSFCFILQNGFESQRGYKMKFKTWLEDQRRKPTIGNKHTKDHAHGKRGQLAGNVRYSGKGGFGSTQQPNNFRNRDQQKPQNEIVDAILGGAAGGLAGYAADKAAKALSARKKKKEEERNGK